MVIETIEKYEEENKKGGLKILFSFLVFLLIISLLIFYFFVPIQNFQFLPSEQSDNFSINGLTEMQFFSNMRFADKNISYKITECNLQRTSDMRKAFEILSNLTVLDFYPVDSNEKISITCEEKQKLSGGLWIAGEGGPTNRTPLGEFNLIPHGQILLLQDSECPRPNIAIHELLHVLGFDHSTNKKNIMYNISNCDQTIGKEIIDFINEIYSIETLPDLYLENVSATIQGKYLNANVTIRNYGFKDSEEFNLLIYADGSLIKELENSKLSVGYGMILSLSNIFIPQISVSELEFVLDSSFPELNKKNNRINLIVN